MNPLAAYLYSVMVAEARDITSQRYIDHEHAMEAMGYWTQSRPAGYSMDEMPEGDIPRECLLISSFAGHVPAEDGYNGYDVMVDLYADPEQIDQVTTSRE